MISHYSNLFQRIALLGLILLGTTCSSAPELLVVPPQPQSTTESIDELLRQAELRSGDSAVELRLQAINDLIAEGYIDRATSELEFIREPTNLNSNLQLQFLVNTEGWTPAAPPLYAGYTYVYTIDARAQSGAGDETFDCVDRSTGSTLDTTPTLSFESEQQQTIRCEITVNQP